MCFEDEYPDIFYEYLDNVKDFPIYPHIIARLETLINNPNSDVSDLERTISSDSGVVTRILKMVNSPSFGFSDQIKNIKIAIVLLGYKKLRDLIMMDFLYQISDRRNLNLWKHSLSTAHFSVVLSDYFESPVEKPDIFLCGLLHDIGKLLTLKYFPKNYNSLEISSKRDCKKFAYIEDQTQGYNHAELGAFILYHWDLPEIFCNVVKYHHYDDIYIPDEYRPLLKIIRLANTFSLFCNIGNNGEPDQIINLNDITELTDEQKVSIIYDGVSKYSEQIEFLKI